jgi:hypothetical protein
MSCVGYSPGFSWMHRMHNVFVACCFFLVITMTCGLLLAVVACRQKGSDSRQEPWSKGRFESDKTDNWATLGAEHPQQGHWYDCECG